jgi:hypothetical protein
LRAVRPVKFRRGKEFLLIKPEEEKVQVTLQNFESGNAEIVAVILRHLVNIIQRFVIGSAVKAYCDQGYCYPLVNMINFPQNISQNLSKVLMVSFTYCDQYGLAKNDHIKQRQL